MHNLALDKCQIESFYGLLRLLIFIVSIFWHSKFCVESLSITFFNKSFSLFSSVTKYQFNSEGIYLAVVIYLLFCLDRELLLGNGLSSLPSFYPRLFLPKCITQSYHASDTWVTHPGATLPWVPETFLARFRFLSSLYSDPLRRSWLRPTAEDVSAFGQHRKFHSISHTRDQQQKETLTTFDIFKF